jgi:hypothetical protein
MVMVNSSTLLTIQFASHIQQRTNTDADGDWLNELNGETGTRPALHPIFTDHRLSI